MGTTISSRRRSNSTSKNKNLSKAEGSYSNNNDAINSNNNNDNNRSQSCPSQFVHQVNDSIKSSSPSTAFKSIINQQQHHTPPPKMKHLYSPHSGISSSVDNENNLENKKSNTSIAVSDRNSDASLPLLINVDYTETDKLRQELLESKRQVYEREQQLLKLHREVHKLRSVLDHSHAIKALKSTPSIDMLLIQGADSMDSGSNFFMEKKKGVSGESFGPHKSHRWHNINFVNKDFDCRRVIQEAFMDNSFLKNYLNQEQLDLIVNSMYEKEFAKNCFICRRGTHGSHLYVISYGHCEVIDARDRPVNQIGPGKAFGELALLYNCTRTASVKTLTRVRTWVLDRKVFQMIMMKTSMDRTQSIKKFLRKVPLLQNLSDEKISKITDAVEVEYYPRGEYICRQGSFGDSFYIISKGSVRVTQLRRIQIDNQEHNGQAIQFKEETIRTLFEGDYFGEQALLVLEGARETLDIKENEHPVISSDLIENIGAVRTANVISEECECFVLDQTSFFNLLGESQEIKYKSYTDQINGNVEGDHSKQPNGSASQLSHLDESSDPFDLFIKKLTLDDFDVVTQLGMGGFGVVNLVRCKSDHNQVFAMKKCSKEFIRASHQQQHIINEKLVMQRVSGKHQFIIQLYRTFQDDGNVYFLMETSLGGELWTHLRQRGPFNEQSVRFYTACIIEALQYLHSVNIIYRDLKPENCLLDPDGYLKLTDFGFSKSLLIGEKTWTFCGTPEYVAPEIILNRGHDRSVDIWALGILIYELLTGMPPFTSSDPLQTYHIILRGFDSIGFDEKIFSKNCVNLIRNLCRENPNERLGIRGRNGYNDIKRHKWFTGFSWNNLINRKISSPFVPKLTSNTDTRHFQCFVPTTNKDFFGDHSTRNVPTNGTTAGIDSNNNHVADASSKDNLIPTTKDSGSWFKTLSSARKTSMSPKEMAKSKRISTASSGKSGSVSSGLDNQEETMNNEDSGEDGSHLESITDWENYF